MKIKRFTRVIVKDSIEQAFKLLNDQLESILPYIVESPIVSVQRLDKIELNGTDAKSIQHSLGKNYQGFIVISNTAGAAVYEAETTTSKAKAIVLNASAACTISILIF